MTKITTFLKAIKEKLTENANEAIETKNHVVAVTLTVLSMGKWLLPMGKQLFCV